MQIPSKLTTTLPTFSPPLRRLLPPTSRGAPAEEELREPFEDCRDQGYGADVNPEEGVGHVKDAALPRRLVHEEPRTSCVIASRLVALTRFQP